MPAAPAASLWERQGEPAFAVSLRRDRPLRIGETGHRVIVRAQLGLGSHLVNG